MKLTRLPFAAAAALTTAAFFTLTVPAGATPSAPRYCAEVAAPGSLVLRKMCMTKPDWARRGIDVDAAVR